MYFTSRRNYYYTLCIHNIPTNPTSTKLKTERNQLEKDFLKAVRPAPQAQTTKELQLGIHMRLLLVLLSVLCRTALAYHSEFLEEVLAKAKWTPKGLPQVLGEAGQDQVVIQDMVCASLSL